MSLSEAIEGAREADLGHFYQKPAQSKPSPIKDNALETLHYLTLIRMCSAPAVMASYDGDLAHAPKDLWPWFTLRHHDDSMAIYFGHWAALGLYRYKNYQCLDSGCVWGGKLTALRLEEDLNNKSQFSKLLIYP